MSTIPDQFTGQAALARQDPAAFDLHAHAYTPRAFGEDDVVIKVECCGICGVSVPSCAALRFALLCCAPLCFAVLRFAFPCAMLRFASPRCTERMG